MEWGEEGIGRAQGKSELFACRVSDKNNFKLQRGQNPLIDARQIDRKAEQAREGLEWRGVVLSQKIPPDSHFPEGSGAPIKPERIVNMTFEQEESGWCFNSIYGFMYLSIYICMYVCSTYSVYLISNLLTG